jgi:outer membrane protein OmpA-like peptidoglycan-associated protein
MPSDWLSGHFSGYVHGTDVPLLRGIARRHSITWHGGRVEGARPIDGPRQDSADALNCGRIHSVWVEIPAKDGGNSVWYETALEDVRLHNWSYRLATDNHGTSVTWIEGEIEARVPSPRPVNDEQLLPPVQDVVRPMPTAPVPVAAPVVLSGLGAPVIAAQRAGCAHSGCLLPLLLSCGIFGLAFGWFDWRPSLFALLMLALFAFLPRLWVGVALPGCALGMGATLGFGILAWLAIPLIWSLFSHGCSDIGIGTWLLLALALVLVSFARPMAARIVGGVLFLLCVFLVWRAWGGCSRSTADVARDWVEERTTHDAVAEGAVLAVRREGGERRLTLDDALEQSWPRMSNCEQPIHLSTDFLFDTDSAVIASRAEPQMRKLATLIRRAVGASVEIDGHADQRGLDQHNQDLSLRRADAVRRWLVDHRVLPRTRIDVHGYGATRPIVQVGDTSLALRYNRRVEVVLHCDEGTP